MQKEFEFWQNNRAQSYYDPDTGEELFQFYQYRVVMKVPRPESYREDKELVEDIESEGFLRYKILHVVNKQ